MGLPSERRFKSRLQGLGFEIRSGVGGGGGNNVPRFPDQPNNRNNERPCPRDFQGRLFGGANIAGLLEKRRGPLWYACAVGALVSATLTVLLARTS